MKKLLLILFFIPFIGKSQSVGFSTSDSNFLWKYRNGSGVYSYGKGRPLFANELTRNTSASLKAIVFDSVAWSTRTPPYFFYQNIGGGSSITHYVDSSSTNAGGDSLVVVYGSGTRRAYLLPGGSSQWTTTTGGIYYNSGGVSIGQTSVDAKLHVTTSNDASPLSFTDWGSQQFVVGASGSRGGGLSISRTDGSTTMNMLAVAPSTAWWNFNIWANSFALKNPSSVVALSMSSSGQAGLGPVTNYYSTVQNAGSVGYSYTAQSGTYSITGNDYLVEYASTGGHTYTLPTVSSATGRTYTIVNSGTGALNIATTSSQTFTNIASAPTTLTIPQKSSVMLSANTTGWMVQAFSGRNRDGQGADVASANNLALGSYGSTFSITGTTQINLLTTTGFLDGDVVRIIFTSTPTVKNGQTTSGSNVTILLAGAADFSATANDVLTLVLSTSGGTQAWREVGRSVN